MSHCMINLYPYIRVYGMFIYIPICMYIYLPIHAYVCISIHRCVCLYTHVHMCFFYACWQRLKVILFIFVYAGSSLLPRFFSSCSKWGLLCSFGVWAYCSDFSCCRSQALGCMGFANCSTWLSSCRPPQALRHRLS